VRFQWEIISQSTSKRFQIDIDLIVSTSIRHRFDVDRRIISHWISNVTTFIIVVCSHIVYFSKQTRIKEKREGSFLFHVIDRGFNQVSKYRGQFIKYWLLYRNNCRSKLHKLIRSKVQVLQVNLFYFFYLYRFSSTHRAREWIKVRIVFKLTRFELAKFSCIFINVYFLTFLWTFIFINSRNFPSPVHINKQLMNNVLFFVWPIY